MQQPTVTQLPKSQVKLAFVVTPEDAKPYLDAAVTDVSNAKPIKGFRPGKATYEDVKRAYSEMTIWETALERIVRAQYVKAVLDLQLETVGSPAIEVGKLVPGSDIEFTVTANVMPNATSLADYSKPQVDLKKKEITDKEVDHAIDDLRKMRRVEVVVDRPATKDDMTLVDLVIKKDNVQVEGGTSSDYRVVLNEDHYIPGFAAKLVGAKKGDDLAFELDFPKDHYNKHLAGQKLQFEVKVKDVYEMQLPPIDETFAKSLGVETVEKLREILKTNLQHEADEKSEQAAEIELLEKLVKGSRFTDIPDLITTEEVRRMIAELDHSLTQQGGNLKDYLSSIKKTMDDLRLDFVPRAIQRVQTAVILKEVGKREQIAVADAEIDAEIDNILEALKPTDTEGREQVSSPEYREYVAMQMKNHKVVAFLKDKGVKKV